jgi:predicted transcriptional regulator
MPDSIVECLRSDVECEGLLEIIYGLTRLDREVFRLLVDGDAPMTVDEVADAVGRERSTAYRSIQRLLRTGFVEKEQVNYEQGGYYHVYRPSDADDVADDMQRALNDWYATVGQLIYEFRDAYDGASETVEATRAE